MGSHPVGNVALVVSASRALFSGRLMNNRAHARMHTHTSEGERGGDAKQQRKARKVCEAT